MKFCRNFVDILENVEISNFPKFLNFPAKIPEFWKNFDRTLIWKVRMVRSLADRTFQIRAPRSPRARRRCTSERRRPGDPSWAPPSPARRRAGRAGAQRRGRRTRPTSFCLFFSFARSESNYHDVSRVPNEICCLLIIYHLTEYVSHILFLVVSPFPTKFICSIWKKTNEKTKIRVSL